jgi:phospholipid/cholesterol/gamma-HCH transport system substrate-binding protein
MSRNIVETLVGALVLLVAGGFAAYAVQRTTVNTSDSYPLIAYFDSVDGIGVGNDIRIGGIKIGVVSGMMLDNDSYRAKVTLALRNDVKVPDDSSVAIVSESLLGNKYVAIQPGGSDEMLLPGDELMITQSSVNLEHLIGKFMFGGEEGKKSSDASPAPAEAPSATVE